MTPPTLRNYDLMKESHGWTPQQYRPSLLLPRLRQYRNLSGRDKYQLHKSLNLF